MLSTRTEASCSTGIQPVPPRRNRSQTRATTLAIALLLLLPSMNFAAAKVQPGGTINLPYTPPDGKSPAWIIQQGGWIQQRRVGADESIYSQGAMLTIDQNNPNQTTNQGRLDPKTGELTLDTFQPMNGVQVTRRIQIRRDDDLLPCIDIFKNVGGAA